MSRLPVWLTRVQSNSMAPALSDGQLVWTARRRGQRSFRRGMVVVVDSREVGHLIIKRIVGLPGEHLCLEAGQVFVDGHLLAEPYAVTSSTYRGTFHVPDGHYVLLGDNRDASSDSRSWCHPFVARTEIVGRVLRTDKCQLDRITLDADPASADHANLQGAAR